VLFERFADEILHLLPSAGAKTADQTADSAANAVGGARNGAARIECTGEVCRDHERLGPPGDVERSPRNGEGEICALQQLRNRILRLAGKIVRRLCLEHIVDRRHGDGGPRKNRQFAGERLKRRHRHELRMPLL
jgi:hypothetical protein